MRKIAILALILLFPSAGHAAAGGTIVGKIQGMDGSAFKAAFIRAQNIESKMTTMVLSNQEGKYVVTGLAPGSYEIWATSLGYKSDPARRSDIKVENGTIVSLNFTMQKSPVRWAQLTRYQAGMLLPKPTSEPEAKDRDVLLQNCFGCHGMSKWGMRMDHDGWLNAIGVMRVVGVADIDPKMADEAATYLASVFGPDSNTPASPDQLPDFKSVLRDHDSWSDDALNIEYVDYKLTGEPKDRPGTGRPDKYGNIWMEMGGGLAKLNPETGEFKTFRLDDPTRPEIHEVFPTPDGASVWLTITNENSLARFDTRTEKFDPVYKDAYDGPRPVQTNTIAPWPQFRNNDTATISNVPRAHTAIADLAGNIWVSGRPLKKFDIETKQFTNFPDVPDTYGIAIDKQGIIWAGEFTARDYRKLVRVDPKTNKVTKFTPPNTDDKLNGAPRRVKVDSQGYVWCADYFGGNLTRFDPKTETFKIFKIPGPTPTPYGMGVDHNDNIWYTSFYTDVSGRLDPKTGKFTEYPSPYGERSTRDLVEDSKGRIWYGAQDMFRVGYMRLRTPSEMAAIQSIKQ
jgi:virginiamycin B lyase